MSIGAINSDVNHAKSIIESQRSNYSLPFQDVLSAADLQKHTAEIGGRHRIFTPDLTLYSFLSQVISADQSCQAAVAQGLAQVADQNTEVAG